MKILINVDMQKDFLEADGKLSLGKDTTDLKQRVANKIKSWDGIVVTTLDSHNTDSVEFQQFPEHCVRGTEGVKLSNEITQALKECNAIQYEIEKESFSGVGVTELLLKLLEENPNAEFEAVGVCTHVCVHDIVSNFVHASKEKLNVLPKIKIDKTLVDDFDAEMASVALIRLQRLSAVEVV